MRASDPSAAGGSHVHHAAPVTVTLAAGHAVICIAAFEWPGFSLAILAAPLLLGWLAIGARSAARAALVVLALQTAMWLWMCRWIIPITAAGYPLLAVYMALYPALLVWIVARLARSMPAWPMTLLLPPVWVGLELLRGTIVLDGYPWYLLGHPLVEWPPLAQTADLVGAYGVSFIAALPAGAALDLLRWRSARPALRRRAAVGAGVVLAVGAAHVGYGLWRVAETDALPPGPRVLVIQTNLPQDNKIGWTPERQQVDVPHFIQLTRDALDAAEPPPDLVVWPETMLPGIGLEPETLDFIDRYGSLRGLRQWTDAAVELQRDIGVPLLVGSIAWIGPGVKSDEGTTFLQREREFNSAYLIHGAPPFQRYDKVFLTPFGETMPYISRWPWLEQKLLALGAGGMSFSLDRAEAPQILAVDPGGIRFATPICFEDTVAGLCRRMVHDDGNKRIDLLINLSNDGWFGTYDAGRRMHARIARYRCIENRVPMVRAVNTGYSVSIDSAGRLRGGIGSDEGEGRYGRARRDGWLSTQVAVDERSTLYARIGDAWAWACLAVTAALIIGTFAGRRGGS